jgi:hypothetical protein
VAKLCGIISDSSIKDPKEAHIVSSTNTRNNKATILVQEKKW